MKDTSNPDKLWRSFLNNCALMVKHRNGMESAARLFRRAAYRAAVDWLALQKEHHNYVLQMVRSTGMKIDEWMDQQFDPIEQMGDTRQRLMAAIETGMTEKQYVAQGRLWIIRKRATSPQRTTAIAETPEPQRPEPATDAERIEYLTDLCESYRSQLQALKSELRQARRDLATTLDENERQNRLMAKLERDIKRMTKHLATKRPQRKATART